MSSNHVLLETINLTQAAATVTFDNIPQTGYTDLKVVWSTRDTSASAVNNIIIRLNSVTTSQSCRFFVFTGTSFGNASADTPLYTSGSVGNNATTNTFSNCELYIPNYSSTSINKSVTVDSVTENNATTAFIQLTAGIYTSNSAITSIQFAPNGSVNFMAGSTFSLYGVAAVGTTPAVAPFATGGNIVANDGTYWYHAFLSSGAFTPQKALTCDVLQIAGGGGGVWLGGGGAGGISYLTSQALTAINYPVAVGSGGSRGTTANAASGTNSQFGTLTAAVGGGGGGYFQTVGSNGGSGGGGSDRVGATTPAVGGTGVSGQGFAGGTGLGDSVNYAAGAGGGGAGGVGGNASFRTGGNGGAGVNTYSSWATPTSTGHNGFFASGGAGASNNPGDTQGTASNGGGSSAAAGNSASAIPNTGGGGAGSGAVSGGVGGNGGSGIVIIRYPMV